MKIDDAKTYVEFKKALMGSSCSKCELSRSRTQLVIDRGNPKAQVMIIGEAPGRNEDRQGKAFVGRSGRLLDRLLEAQGFMTNVDSLIVNVVKCRPPKNRAPLAQEVVMCFPLLQKQLDLVKPRFILLLGATALKHLIPERKKLGMAGQVGDFFTHENYPGIDFMVLYHPAFILRDPRKKPLMAKHLKRFKAQWDLFNASCLRPKMGREK